MRQKKPKPWEALGMSRATWYRHGKPAEKIEPLMDCSCAAVARHDGISIRTVHRMNRVLRADPALFTAVAEHGVGKWGQAEWLIKNPDAHRRWREASGLPWPVRPRSWDE